MTARTRRLALALASVLAAGCANPARPAPGTASRRPPVPVDAGPPPPPRVAERVGGACPVSVERSDVVVARVGPVTLTGCDVAMVWDRHLREGDREDQPRALLHELVREALLASAEPPPTRLPAVDQALAEGLVRAEALAALARELPDEAAVTRYFHAHQEQFSRPERVHLREVVLATEGEAREVHRALSEGAAFEDLVARTVTSEGRRDQGDLGFVPREGTREVPEALASVGFAITEPGGVAPSPVVLASTVPGRRGRTRTVRAWHVVQLVSRVPAEQLPLEAVRRRILQRLTRSRYEALRREARARLVGALAPRVTAAIDARSLGTVRLAPVVEVRPIPGRRR